MSFSAGVSNSTNQSLATKISTGPVTFGSVEIGASDSSQPEWLWIVLAAAGAVVGILLLRKQ